jgi:DNA-binding transcriptional ArsR family regulator
VRYILNHMVQYYQTRFDASFAALSDATRRGVLEQAGLVTTEKVGRVRTCRLGQRRLEEEAAWIERYRQLWASRFDELDKVVEELKRKEKIDGHKKRK